MELICVQYLCSALHGTYKCDILSIQYTAPVIHFPAKISNLLHIHSVRVQTVPTSPVHYQVII